MKTATTGPTDILFAGDVHGRFDYLVKAVKAIRPHALVLLGDLEAPQSLATLMKPLEALGAAVWFIPGNHDTDSQDRWQNLEGLADRNLHGRVATIAGVRIAGLGGIFRGEIWDPAQNAHYSSYADYGARTRLKGAHAQATGEISEKTAGQLLKHRSSIFPDVYERLFDSEADILITHEAPSCHPYGFTAIDMLAQALGVDRLFHGHHHDCRDYRAFDASLGFRAYGVGLRGISDSQGHIIRAGERDLERAERK